MYVDPNAYPYKKYEVKRKVNPIKVQNVEKVLYPESYNCPPIHYDLSTEKKQPPEQNNNMGFGGFNFGEIFKNFDIKNLTGILSMLTNKEGGSGLGNIATILSNLLGKNSGDLSSILNLFQNKKKTEVEAKVVNKYEESGIDNYPKC